MKGLKLSKESVLGLIALLLFILMSAFVPGFFNMSNLSNMFFQLPELGFIALGMTVVILTGGIDLSITYTAVLAGVGAALMLTNGYSVLLAIIVALLIGLACGAFNGFVVSKIGVPAMLVTIGTMVLFEGIALAITKAYPISGFGSTYSLIGNGYLFGLIPLSIVIFAIIAIVVSIFLNKSTWGRRVYMYGNNPIATLFSGVRNSRVVMKVYLFSGLMAALAGIIMTSRYNSVTVDLGSSYMFQAVAASVLGGTNIMGGYGKVVGTVYAVIIFQILSNGLNLLGVHRAIVDVLTGVILITVLTINFFKDKRENNKEIQSAQKKAEKAV